MIKLNDALDCIMQHETNLGHGTSYSHDIRSIVTHWLQSPDEHPLFVNPSKSKEWRQVLGESMAIKIDLSSIPFAPPLKPDFTFIDLFAGIGGFRLALQSLRGKCVFTSEWDRFAKQTYATNFGEIPFGDITTVDENQIPKHDVLCGGFPCQAFSIAGKKGGFEDTRGTLFFDVARILRSRQPSAFFLENVKGLLSHRGGKTIRTILNVLRNDLGYYVPDPQVIRAEDFGVPQKRGRVFIIGFHPRTGVEQFDYPKPLPGKAKIADIKEAGPVSVKYYISTCYLKSMKRHRERHESKGNGFGYEIIPDDGIANTIVIGGMGKERNLVIDHSLEDFTPVTKIKGTVNREGIRRMTPREWARLQGYPDTYLLPKSDAQAYKQLGNSVAVPAIRATAQQLLDALKNPRKGPCKQLDLFGRVWHK
jgi:DNA (cytosine-5)-methyltransferase 1